VREHRHPDGGREHERRDDRRRHGAHERRAVQQPQQGKRRHRSTEDRRGDHAVAQQHVGERSVGVDEQQVPRALKAAGRARVEHQRGQDPGDQQPRAYRGGCECGIGPPALRRRVRERGGAREAGRREPTRQPDGEDHRTPAPRRRQRAREHRGARGREQPARRAQRTAQRELEAGEPERDARDKLQPVRSPAARERLVWVLPQPGGQRDGESADERSGQTESEPADPGHAEILAQLTALRQGGQSQP
jgi:hypothetical protein